MIGWLLIAVGAALVLPQLATTTPWQAGIAAGLALALAGAVHVADRTAR